MCKLKRALFLDRDGVINKDFGHVHQLRDFEFMDGIFALCHSFQAAGYLIVVVTNQAGIARDMYSEHDFQQLSEWMLRRFAVNGVFISAVYFCPHHPGFGAARIQCGCRKPEPGMILRARTDLDLDLGNSILIGDHESDVRAAHAAGVKTTVLLRAPMLPKSPRRPPTLPGTLITPTAFLGISARSMLRAARIPTSIRAKGMMKADSLPLAMDPRSSGHVVCDNHDSLLD